MTDLQIPDSTPVYRIMLSGQLSESWSDWFDGLGIETGLGAAENPITILNGAVPDQSALHGLLDKIRDLGLELLLVEKVEAERTRDEATKESK